MNNNLKILDWVTIISFVVGLYALEIALDNLKENRDQNDELKQILHYLEQHLQDQDNHLKEQDLLFDDLSEHLAKQDKVLFNGKGV